VKHDDVVGLVDRFVSVSTTPSTAAKNASEATLPIWEGSSEGRLKAGLTTPRPAAPIVVKQNANLEQAHLIIATPFPAAPDGRRYAADLLANILGGGMSSRLWQKIREERGLAYSVGTSTAMYMDAGVFSVYAGTSPEQAREVIELSAEELREVVKNGVTANELELAKQLSRASILMNLEDSASRAAALAESEMVHGRQITVEETLENVEAVTLDEVNGLARERFVTDDFAFAAIGDLKELKVEREAFRME
jgi:predicted Zn-dependent peptidase